MYAFVSKNPQGESDHPAAEGSADKCDTWIGIQKVFKRPGAKKITIISLTQTDLKMYIPNNFIKSFGPAQMKNFT